MFLTENEKLNLAYSAVYVEYDEPRRWTRTAFVVVKIDGRFYAYNYEEGLTENQENYAEDGEVEEVFYAPYVRVKAEDRYLTKEDFTKSSETLQQKMLSEGNSFKVATGFGLDEIVSAEVATLATRLLEKLDGLEPMDIVANAGAYRTATQQYLESLVAVQGKNKEG